MATGSKTAVYAAIIGNSVVMVAKFAAFGLTGSSAMLSEGIHSFADVSNQCLLALGIARSERGPDARHPYGYARARYVWSLISAVGIFFLGCGVTLTHGVQAVFDPHPVESPEWSLGVLAFALLIEGGTLAIAVRAVRAQAAEASMGFWSYVRGGSDPTGVAVLLEDGAAVLGVLVAATCIGLAMITGNPVFDGIGSICIGLLLGAIAIFLIDRNRVALLGEAVSPERVARIEALLKAEPGVESVTDIKATVMGAGKVRFKAEIEFDGAILAKRWLAKRDLSKVHEALDSPDKVHDYLVGYTDYVVDALADEIDLIEDRIRAADPAIQHVDLEAD